MSGLHFDVTGNNENFLRKLEETKRGVSEAAKFMESQGKKMDSTLHSVSFGDTLKKQIYEGSQSINGLTAQIIKQKAVIKDIEHDVRNLGEAYRKAGAGTAKGNALFADFKSAKASVQEEKAALFDLQTQQAQARLSVRKLKDEYSLYQKEGRNVVVSNNNMSLSFKKTLAAIGGVAAFKQLGSAIIEARAEMQQLEKSFEVLLGSKAKSDVFVKEIKNYALISPLSTSDVSKAAQTLLGFGVASEKVIPTLKMLGDVSMGNSQRFSSLALAFAQVQAAGKLTGNDLLQLVNAGFNPLKNISEKTGKSMSDLKKEMSDGSISADMVADAFKSATEQGGQFHGMIEKNADGIRNAQNILQGSIQETLNKIGEQNEGLIKGGYEAATYLVENYREIGNCVTGLIGVYGTYRTALLINSVLELGSVKAVWAKITATKAATIAQATYSKVLMMNPYVMVGSALVSLGIAMWTFADNTSTAERAQKRFNERQKEAQKLEQEHKQKIDSLVESSRDSALSDLQRGQSLAELRKEYPKIFEQYDIETIKLADILKLKQQINEEDGRRKTEAEKKDFADIETEIAYYEKLLKSLSGQQGVDGYVKKLKDLRAERDILLQEKGKNISEQFISSLKGLDKSVFDRYIGELEKRIKGIGTSGKVKMKLPIDIKGTLSDEAIYDAKDIKTLIDTTKAAKKAKESSTNSEKKAGTEWLSSYKKAYEDADKAYNDFLKSKKVMSDADRDKELKRLKELRDTAKTTYEAKGGSASSDKKGESAAEKLRKEQESIREQQDKNAQLEKKQSLDRQRQSQDLQNQSAQAEINAMDEGFEKKQAQRELDNKKEIQALERQKEDYINAVIQAEKEKFDAQEELNAKNIKGYNKKTFDSSTVKVDSSAFDGIINNTSKKQLKDKVREQEDSWNEYLIKFGDYQQKRKAIIEKYDKLIKESEDAGKAATYEKDKQNAVDALDSSIKNSSTLMGQLFADASQKSANEIQKVIEKAELLMQYLESVKDEKGNAQIGGKTVSKKDILDLGVSDNTLNNLTTSTEEVEALRNAINKLKGDLGSKSPFELFKSQIKSAVDKLNQGGKKNIAQGITEIGGAISSFSPAISQFGQDLGNIFGSDDLGNKIAGISDALGGVGQTAAGVGQIMSGDIVGGAMSAVSGISSVVSALDGLFGADYSRYNEMKEQYETISSIWDELISKKTEYLEISTTEERNRAEQEILDMISRKEQAARNLGLELLNSGASAGSHSIGVRIREDMSDEGWSQWDNFANSIGMIPDDIGGRLEGLFSLSSEQLDKLKGDAPDFWAKLDGDVRTYLEDIIKCGEQTEETTKKTEELWAGMSFDSMVDQFRDALSDMNSSTEDFADDFQQYMINAMIDSFINGDVFQKKLKDWHKKLAEYSESDKKITEDEKNNLQKEWDDIVKEGIDYRDSLFESMGFSNSSSTSQDSTSGGFETMSQDTGEELNGRFTALQISNEEIKNAMLSMLVSVNFISVSVGSNGITLTEIRNLMISSNSYLEDIAKYTKELIGFKQTIANIETSAKAMAGK